MSQLPAVEQARRKACSAMGQLTIEAMRMPITQWDRTPEEIIAHTDAMLAALNKFQAALQLLQHEATLALTIAQKAGER